MSRWKFPTVTVTEGENSVKVRGLTQGERAELAQVSKKAAAEGQSNATVQAWVLKAGVTDPPLSAEEVLQMPADLGDSAATKILELTGLTEKKAEPTAS